MNARIVNPARAIGCAHSFPVETRTAPRPVATARQIRADASHPHHTLPLPYCIEQEFTLRNQLHRY